MRFLHDVKNSLYNPAYYATLRERSLGRSFKYFFGLSAALALAMAFFLGLELAPLFSATNLRKLVDYFPAELTLTLKSGMVSTNVEEPYFIKTEEMLGKKGEHENLAVIDTKTEFSRELLRSYDTYALIGRDFLATEKSRNQLQVMDTEGLPDLTLNRDTLLSWANLIGSRYSAISLGLFAALFLAFFGSFAVKLVWFLVLALIILLFGRVKQVALSYKQAYQLALHATTVPFVIAAIFTTTGTSEPFLFFYSLLLLIIVFMNLKRAELPPTPTPTVPSTVVQD